ncbi:hypothetical protein HF1_03660 [Mycoplasma haemofelis str. Langford 1]|uniref:Uncharacterized protein n=1 Tax=Mycoplasma haemofelis (strain Langford 1) TaxID=941640 RepID=E8ZGV3_MYCHL|nr:hypothetical protein [Mycoplasma haemofelis]CBY92374.1 hypothetical protein HF1_03660 [Mycoplasma haemofelis str. Langford 1]
MTKGSFLALGTAGAGGLGAGGLMAFKPWQSTPEEKVKVATSIREKYSAALLDSTQDGSIWEKKYTTLKTSTPNNPTLKQAVEKSKTSPESKDEALRLLKEGCASIYDSKVDDLKSFSDFKTLCSKSNDDASKASGAWIADEASANNNKWDSSLTKLRDHNQELIPTLSSLKEEIKAHQNSTPFAQDIRTKIKDWCTQVRGELFEGENSTQFQNQEAFCKATG